MKEEFIHFFVDFAQQKLKVKYSIVRMILHTLPYIKSNWKEFKQDTETFSLDELMIKYPSLEVREYKFINFIEQGNLSPDDMKLILDTHKTIDLKNVNREYAYTEEELKYYLRSRLKNRMMVKTDHLECDSEQSMPSKRDRFPIPEFV